MQRHGTSPTYIKEAENTPNGEVPAGDGPAAGVSLTATVLVPDSHRGHYHRPIGGHQPVAECGAGLTANGVLLVTRYNAVFEREVSACSACSWADYEQPATPGGGDRAHAPQQDAHADADPAPEASLFIADASSAGER